MRGLKERTRGLMSERSRVLIGYLLVWRVLGRGNDS